MTPGQQFALLLTVGVPIAMTLAAIAWAVIDGVRGVGK